MSSSSWFGPQQKNLFVRSRTHFIYALVALGVLIYVINSQRLAERLYFNWLHWVQFDELHDNAVWLPDYRAVIEAKPIAQIASDLSGITYDFDNDQLLAINNAGQMRIVAMSKQGDVSAIYPLIGFKDTEDISYMGDGLVAVVEERSHSVCFIQLPATPGPINRAHVRSVTIGVTKSGKNKGFEGVDYDAQLDRLYIVKERDPRQLYVVSGVRESLKGNLQLDIQDLTEWVNRSVFSTDLSAVHHDARTGHLLVLSDESNALYELNGDGDLVSSRTFIRGLSEVKQSVAQAEGVTMDAQGNLYLISEPNLFYTFEKSQAKLAKR